MKRVGLDSQCLSYLIDAIQGIEQPTGALAAEKVALFRIYLHTPGTLFVTPTVVDECARIRNVERRKLHESYLNVLFDEWQIENEAAVDKRTKELLLHHDGQADCRVLAEAEHAGFSVLLSYDRKFLKRLGCVVLRVVLARPSDYWCNMGIPTGTQPDKAPHITNPLADETWWQW